MVELGGGCPIIEANSPTNAGKLNVRPHLAVSLILLLGSSLHLPSIGFALGDPIDFRKTQTAFVVREFFRNGIDVLSYPLPVLGAAGSVPMEMPIFQAGAALIQQLGGSTEFSGQLLSLLMFQFSAALTYLIAKRLLSMKTAFVSLVLMQLMPYSIEWGSAFLMESTALAFTLSSVLAVMAFAERKRPTVAIIAVSFSVLAFVSKITTPVGWFAGLAVLQLSKIAEQKTFAWRALLKHAGPLVLVGTSGLAAGLAWTQYADGVKAEHPLTSLLQSSALRAFNFGTLEQRLELFPYLVFASRIWLEIMGFSVFFLLILLFRLVKSRNNAELAKLGFLLVAASFGPLVFFNIYTHDYYFIPLVPAFAILAGWSVVSFIDSLGVPKIMPVAFATLILLATLWTSFWGAKDIYTAFTRPEPDPRVQILSSATVPSDDLIMVGCGWNPTLLYLSDRKGLMIPDYYIEEDVWRKNLSNDMFPDKQTRFNNLWKFENLADYEYLYVCDQRDVYWPAGFKFEPTVYPSLYRVEQID